MVVVGRKRVTFGVNGQFVVAVVGVSGWRMVENGSWTV
jgi:hypothetical protein